MHTWHIIDLRRTTEDKWVSIIMMSRRVTRRIRARRKEILGGCNNKL